MQMSMICQRINGFFFHSTVVSSENRIRNSASQRLFLFFRRKYMQNFPFIHSIFAQRTSRMTNEIAYCDCESWIARISSRCLNFANVDEQTKATEHKQNGELFCIFCRFCILFMRASVRFRACVFYLCIETMCRLANGIYICCFFFIQLLAFCCFVVASWLDFGLMNSWQWRTEKNTFFCVCDVSILHSFTMVIQNIGRVLLFLCNISFRFCCWYLFWNGDNKSQR